MKTVVDRREFFKRSSALAAAPAVAALLPQWASAQGKVSRSPGSRVKIALNAYSFNKPLSAGEITLPELVEYCAKHKFDALDATGYYFPGYPAVPADEYLYALKRKAFVNGITINGTGVRNDFAVADETSRKRDVQMVKNWVEVARKLGATVVRVFSGKTRPEGYSFDQAMQWMVADYKECVAHGKKHGVIVALQPHDDFVKTADEAIRIVDAVDSDWFGIILDVGSLRQSDPYAEIEKLLPYAVSWQLKETVWYGDKEVPTDLKRVKAIIDKVGYRGFVPIETLGPGDPRTKVAKYVQQVYEAFEL